MSIKPNSPTLLIFLTVIFLYGCRNNESVLLRLNFKKDEDYSYNMKVKFFCNKSNYVTEEVGATLSLDSTKNHFTYFLTTRVKTIKTDIKAEQFPENDISETYNSDDGYPEPKYDSILSRYYKVVLNNKGENLSPFVLNEKSFGLGFVQLAYPEKKVKIGDSWTIDIQTPFSGMYPGVFSRKFDFKLNFICTVKNITKEKVLLDVDVKIQPNNLYSSSNYKGSGVYTIDRATGQTLEGYITLPAGSCDDALISIVSK